MTLVLLESGIFSSLITSVKKKFMEGANGLISYQSPQEVTKRFHRGKVKRAEREIKFLSLVNRVDPGLAPQLRGLMCNNMVLRLERFKMDLMDLMDCYQGKPPETLWHQVFYFLLKTLHRLRILHVQHLDIKAENILYNGTGSDFVLADWDCAHFNFEPKERLYGTFLCWAPELFENPRKEFGRHVSHAADVFAAGYVLMELIRGRNYGVWKSLWWKTRQLLHHDPHERVKWSKWFYQRYVGRRKTSLDLDYPQMATRVRIQTR